MWFKISEKGDTRLEATAQLLTFEFRKRFLDLVGLPAEVKFIVGTFLYYWGWLLLFSVLQEEGQSNNWLSVGH